MGFLFRQITKILENKVSNKVIVEILRIVAEIYYRAYRQGKLMRPKPRDYTADEAYSELYEKILSKARDKLTIGDYQMAEDILINLEQAAMEAGREQAQVEVEEEPKVEEIDLNESEIVEEAEKIIKRKVKEEG